MSNSAQHNLKSLNDKMELMQKSIDEQNDKNVDLINQYESLKTKYEKVSDELDYLKHSEKTTDQKKATFTTNEYEKMIIMDAESLQKLIVDVVHETVKNLDPSGGDRKMITNATTETLKSTNFVDNFGYSPSVKRKYFCTYCNSEGHLENYCYLNPESSKYRFS